MEEDTIMIFLFLLLIIGSFAFIFSSFISQAEKNIKNNESRNEKKEKAFRRFRLYQSLQDLDMDFSMGKIDKEEKEALSSRMISEAARLMKTSTPLKKGQRDKGA